MRKTENNGFSLIELIIGIAIMSIVGLAAASLLGSSVSMYHSTLTYAEVQTESQTVSRRLSALIMDAANLYFEDTEEGTFLYTGNKSEAAHYTGGTIMWFNKDTGCLYLSDAAPVMDGDMSEETDGEKGALSASTVRNALEGGTDSRLFLISSHVEKFELSVDEEVTAITRAEPGRPNYYQTNQDITVNYTITMKYLDGKDYVTSSAASPRNRLGYLRWRRENGT